MSYIRVLPRDLFNEAKLLKCLGILALKIHDGNLGPMLRFDHEHPNLGFIIDQTIDGDTYVRNLFFFINDQRIELFSPLNSREVNPLYAVYDEEMYSVFDDDGNFNIEFFNLWRILGVNNE